MSLPNISMRARIQAILAAKSNAGINAVPVTTGMAKAQATIQSIKNSAENTQNEVSNDSIQS